MLYSGCSALHGVNPNFKKIVRSKAYLSYLNVSIFNTANTVIFGLFSYSLQLLQKYLS